MLTGGSEAAISGLAIAGFQNMRALSMRNDAPEQASRPFDKDRDGFVLGDGAAMVMLESLEHAQARGATILGEVLGYGLSGDAYHITSPAPSGEGAQRAMRDCLRDGGVAAERVGYINAHGTSTSQGDIAETAAVKAVFGAQARKLIFASTKSMTGHLLGAAGGLEFAVSLLVCRTGKVPPTINQVTPDPECDLDCAPNVAVERTVDVALSNSFRVRRAQRHAGRAGLEGLSPRPPVASHRAGPGTPETRLRGLFVPGGGIWHLRVARG